MKRTRLLLLAGACLPLLVQAQPAPKVTDADATVPPLTYQSAFADYRPAAAAKTSPDKVWIAANREVSGQADQAAPAARPDNAPAADPHKGHHMNMKGH